MEYLRHVTPVPSVSFHQRAPDGMNLESLETVTFDQEERKDEYEEESSGGGQRHHRVAAQLWGPGAELAEREGSGRARNDISYRSVISFFGCFVYISSAGFSGILFL